MKALEEIASKFQNSGFNRFGKVYYSQEGEGAILNRYLYGWIRNFHIGIRTSHPIRFTNTCLLNKLRCNGINIETRSGSSEINLKIELFSKSKKLSNPHLNYPDLNSHNELVSIDKENILNYRFIEKIEVKTLKLKNILDKHLPKKQIIDFLTKDFKWKNYKVNLSNNNSKNKPEVKLSENLLLNLKEQNSPSYLYLTGKGYELFAKTIDTILILNTKKCKKFTML
ncbi:MAG: hypothetical protein IAE91_14865 [Ignavibacteriaceae bacterium]|nr:hypothetical protein [Ignavibacteriaceae bacterium]